MAKRKFVVSYVVTATLEIEEDLIEAALLDDWKKDFYNLEDAEGVAAHLAFNMIQGRTLASLDGFGDRNDLNDVKVSSEFDIESSSEVKA